MKILALDLGKFNTLHCLFDTKTRKYEFLTAATDRGFLTLLNHQSPLHAIVIPVLEQPGRRFPT
jgi:hypothetical protein